MVKHILGNRIFSLKIRKVCYGKEIMDFFLFAKVVFWIYMKNIKKNLVLQVRLCK
ncbi:protein of unknown function [Ruminococcaceae bacterium BL-6]|nr:protein of unknown function [Ruminococcaceae bacterium BL-6]